MNIKETLTDYGLSEKEIALYLAALELGAASITQLSKKAGLKRPTTYLVIDNLLKKGLLIEIPKGKKVHYKPEEPQELIKSLENRKRKIEEILGELQNLYIKSSKRPGVRFYEGKERILKIYEEIFRAKEIWSIFSAESYFKNFSETEDKHLFRILIRNGGIIYGLHEDTKKAREYYKEPYRYGVSKDKFLPRGVKIATEILVYENKTALIAYATLTGVIVEDESISQTLKIMMKLLWECLPGEV